MGTCGHWPQGEVLQTKSGGTKTAGKRRVALAAYRGSHWVGALAHGGLDDAGVSRGLSSFAQSPAPPPGSRIGRGNSLPPSNVRQGQDRKRRYCGPSPNRSREGFWKCDKIGRAHV